MITTLTDIGFALGGELLDRRRSIDCAATDQSASSLIIITPVNSNNPRSNDDVTPVMVDARIFSPRARLGFTTNSTNASLLKNYCVSHKRRDDTRLRRFS